ncbi:MAG: hypothetical protein WAN20_13545 [Pseudonocardiaceae bacterium]
MVVPGGLSRWLRRRGFTAVTELGWWEWVRVGGLEVTFVPAHLWSRRGLSTTARPCGAALSSPSRMACGCTTPGQRLRAALRRDRCPVLGD